NPLHSSSYHHIAALIAFELGDYQKCLALGSNASTPWIDFPAVMAAACFETNDQVGMHKYWNEFLEDFRKHISGSEDTDEAEALQWIINVSPYQEKTNLLPFWEFIAGRKVTPRERTF